MPSLVRPLPRVSVIRFEDHKPENVDAGRNAGREDGHATGARATPDEFRVVVDTRNSSTYVKAAWAVPSHSSIGKEHQFCGQEGEVDDAVLLDTNERDPGFNAGDAYSIAEQAIERGTVIGRSCAGALVTREALPSVPSDECFEADEQRVQNPKFVFELLLHGQPVSPIVQPAYTNRQMFGRRVVSAEVGDDGGIIDVTLGLLELNSIATSPNRAHESKERVVTDKRYTRLNQIQWAWRAEWFSVEPDGLTNPIVVVLLQFKVVAVPSEP